MKLLLCIAYLGTSYCGYQVQPNGVTVQQRLCEAARAVFGYECDIVGCSRTDSGVHARGFCATVSKRGENTLTTTIPTDRVPRVFNLSLPPDISVLAAREVDDAFHARYDVVKKEYEYLFRAGGERDPFLADRVWQLDRKLSDDAIARMDLAAQGFVGKHDFSALRDKNEDEKDAVREVYSASVTRKGDLISFRVAANGFLYHMVRIMAGTLLAVASGKIEPHTIGERILSLDRTQFGITAPASGLYLDRVTYQNINF